MYWLKILKVFGGCVGNVRGWRMHKKCISEGECVRLEERLFFKFGMDVF